MKVKQLSLSSFRGFDRLTLEFAPNAPTVIIGNNGLGKSSILDALATLLSWLFEGIKSKPKKTKYYALGAMTIYHPGINFIGTKDIKAGSDRLSAEITVELGDRSSVTWSISNIAFGTDGEKIDHNFDELNPLSDRLKKELSAGQQPNLILVVHYPVNRAVLEMPLEMPDNYAFEQLDAYQHALGEQKISFESFFQWFRPWEDLENEQRRDDPDYRDKYLEAVRKAIYALIPELSNLRVRRNPLRMTALKNANNNAEEFRIEQLSDGEKCLLAMAGDLARRLALANPRLENPLQGNGIVLIENYVKKLPMKLALMNQS